MKRFTATEKWDKAWFRALAPRLKCLWSYLCDKSDAAGFWEPDFELASFQIGEAVSGADLTHFGDRIENITGGKIRIVSFIEFQYGNLSRDCKAHGPVFRILEKHTHSKGIPKGIHTLKDKEEEEDKDKDKEEVQETDTETHARGGVFAPPSLEEWKAFGTTLKPPYPELEAEKTWHHYEGKGWRIGKNGAKKWKSCLQTCYCGWKKDSMQPNGHANGSTPPDADQENDEAQIRLNLIFGRHPDAKWSREELAVYAAYELPITEENIRRLKNYYGTKDEKLTDWVRPVSLLGLLRKFGPTLDAATRYRPPTLV